MERQSEATEVLVVGAGPTGLTMASELLRHGIPCRVIDREPVRHRESRATDLQARTLEVFDDMGVADKVVARGCPRRAVGIFAGGKPVTHMSLQGADTPYGGVLGLAQYETELLLEGHLEGLGGKVERAVQLATLRQDHEGVDATLLYPDGRWKSERFRWVVGADGAHSSVRHALGTSFEGHTFKEAFFLADVCIDWDIPHDEMAVFSSDRGMVATIGLPGERQMRIFGDLDLDDDRDLDLEHCHQLLCERSKMEANLSDLGWTARFRVHSRMVDRYRRGRVFLTGDAAHIHSPVGGHGMNYGIQDAYNLAWKLALVSRAKARPDLLDSYQVERKPAARALLADTDMETHIGLWRSSLAHQVSSALFKVIGALPPVRQRFLTQQLELAIDYRHSPLCAEKQSSVLGANLTHSADSEAPSVLDHRAFHHGPPAGKRAPDIRFGEGQGRRLFDLLRGPRHRLLLFDGRSATDAGYENLVDIAQRTGKRWGELIDTVVVVPHAERPAQLASSPVAVELDPNAALHHRYGAESECLYLIRPDGYVGFRSQPASGDALEEHLSSYLR